MSFWLSIDCNTNKCDSNFLYGLSQFYCTNKTSSNWNFGWNYSSIHFIQPCDDACVWHLLWRAPIWSRDENPSPLGSHGECDGLPVLLFVWGLVRWAELPHQHCTHRKRLQGHECDSGWEWTEKVRWLECSKSHFYKDLQCEKYAQGISSLTSINWPPITLSGKWDGRPDYSDHSFSENLD